MTNILERPLSPLVPKKYPGQWIAWDLGQTRIIGSATTFAEARQQATAAGERDPIMAKVPRATVRFAG